MGLRTWYQRFVLVTNYDGKLLGRVIVVRISLNQEEELSARSKAGGLEMIAADGRLTERWHLCLSWRAGRRDCEMLISFWINSANVFVHGPRQIAEATSKR